MKKVLGFGDGLDVWRQDEYILKHRLSPPLCVSGFSCQSRNTKGLLSRREEKDLG